MAPEWWQWVISGAMFVTGVVFVATGFGGPAGGALICAGANSIINSYVTEASGGSATAGWFGGMVTGALSGLGAGIAGQIFSDATKIAGVACLGKVAQGVALSYGFGSVGAGTGTTITALIDKERVNVTAITQSAMIGGTLNIGAALFAGVGIAIAEMPLISETSKAVSYTLSTSEAILAEAIIDALSILISLFE